MAYYLGTDKSIRIPEAGDYQNHGIGSQSKVHDASSPLVRQIIQKLHGNVDKHVDFVRLCVNQMESDMLAIVMSTKRHDDNRAAIMAKVSVPAPATNAEKETVDLD